MGSGDRERQKFLMTADLVVLTILERSLKVLLVERGKVPFKGALALPGGFVRVGETIDKAADRELAEETGLAATDVMFERVNWYDAVDRDPRGRVVTCSYLAIKPRPPVPVAGSDAADAAWYDVSDVLSGLQPLAFDHQAVVADAVERARRNLENTTIAATFFEGEFTIAELREVYELFWDVELDRPNFHRKVTAAEEFVVQTGRKTRSGNTAGRPALLYRAGSATVLYPPMTRVSRKRS